MRNFVFGGSRGVTALIGAALLLLLAPAAASATYTDIALEMSGPAEATHGSEFDYAVTIRNRGSNYSATGVVLEDDLPDSVEYIGSTLPGCTLDADALRCSIGTIAKSSSIAGTITVLARRAEVVRNAATIRGDEERSRDFGNNSAEVVTNVTTAADLPKGAPSALAPPLPGQDPIPITGVQAVASPSTGEVLIRTPSETDFRLLTQTEGIPMGSELDASRGRVTITTTRNRSGTRTQTARFADGRFLLEQTGGSKPITDARMTGDLDGCAATGTTASKKAKKGRSLFGRGHGRFRTSGSTGSASIRGTAWLVEDLCKGSTRFSVINSKTKPPKPAVFVDDFTKPGRRNAALAVGESYLAG